MIKINKIVEIIIDGKDIQTITNICEIARVALQENKRKGFSYIDGTERGGAIDSMMEIIFEA